MAATASPFGLRPINLIGGSPITAALSGNIYFPATLPPRISQAKS